MKFMLSLASRRCPGMFVSYYNGPLTTDAEGKSIVVPTKENPIIIYEGGHRSRWLDQIFSNTTEVFPGLDMETLKEIEPEAYDDIRKACIALAVNTHESGTVPKDFINDEYNAINTTMAPFNQGETVASSTDHVRNDLQAELAAAIASRKGGKKARDGDKTELRALVNASLGQIADTKIDSLVGQPDPTEDAILGAYENIQKFESIETQLNALFQNNAAAKKRIINRKSDFKLDATVMVALGNCASDAQRDKVVEDYVSFYSTFFADKAVWTAAVKEVTGGGAGKHNTGNGVFTSRWKKLLNKVRPPTPIAEGESLSAAQA
jgi:hypothetical protein